MKQTFGWRIHLKKKKIFFEIGPGRLSILTGSLTSRNGRGGQSVCPRPAHRVENGNGHQWLPTTGKQRLPPSATKNN